jgi:hypothetical protein
MAGQLRKMSKKDEIQPQDPLNMMVVLTLAGEGAAPKLEAFCGFANKFSDEPWVKWFDQLAKDAEALLDEFERTRQEQREAGATKAEHDEIVRIMRESAKPSKSVRDELAKVLGTYELIRSLSFDPVKCKVMATDSHPSQTPTKKLICYVLCLAIRDRYWQAFRRCREPKCRKFFFDHMDRGRPPQRYCCKRHGDAHRKRIQRGSA